VVVVALAAKMARIVWAVLRHGRAFAYQVHSTADDKIASGTAPETHTRSVEVKTDGVMVEPASWQPG
jgi:hypothetical protein